MERTIFGRLVSKSRMLSVTAITAISVMVFFSSCEDDLDAEQEIPNAPYVLSLGITSSGNTTYYVVSTDNLMEGTVNAVKRY